MTYKVNRQMNSIQSFFTKLSAMYVCLSKITFGCRKKIMHLLGFELSTFSFTNHPSNTCVTWQPCITIIAFILILCVPSAHLTISYCTLDCQGAGNNKWRSKNVFIVRFWWHIFSSLTPHQCAAALWLHNQCTSVLDKFLSNSSSPMLIHMVQTSCNNTPIART